MHLFFADGELLQRCTVIALGDAAWGAHAPIVRRRLMQLDAAPHLTDLLQFPARLRPVTSSVGWGGEIVIAAGHAVSIRALAVDATDQRMRGEAIRPADIAALRIVAVECCDAP